MITVKDYLNSLAFIFTIILIIYGFRKGYDTIELTIYILYFIVAISSQLINLIERKKVTENAKNT